MTKLTLKFPPPTAGFIYFKRPNNRTKTIISIYYEDKKPFTVYSNNEISLEDVLKAVNDDWPWRDPYNPTPRKIYIKIKGKRPVIWEAEDWIMWKTDLNRAVIKLEIPYRLRYEVKFRGW